MITEAKMTRCFSVSLWVAAVAALITVEAQECTEDFRITVTSDGARRGTATRVQTRLIPSLRFTCRGTIKGFTVGGRPRNRLQHVKIQVWRENKAQCGFYYKPCPDITVNVDNCTSLSTRMFQCTLKTSAYVLVLPGDILGIELPPTNNDSFELYFTDGGPVNYVFDRQLSSVVELATGMTASEEPQIRLDVISDELCDNGRLTNVTSDGSGKGATFNVVTRLIPDLQFICEGHIMQFTVGGEQQPGTQDPVIQIWRESPSQCGSYFKPVADIPIRGNVCTGGATMISSGVYHCILKDAFRVPVQPGDILGLELPPTNTDDYQIHFTSGGPINYVFQDQLRSNTALSSRASEVREQPQISIVVDTDPPTGAVTTASSFETTFQALDSTTTQHIITANVETTLPSSMTETQTATSITEATTTVMQNELTTKSTNKYFVDSTTVDEHTTTLRSPETTHTSVDETEIVPRAVSSLSLPVTLGVVVVGIVVLLIVILVVAVILLRWRRNRKLLVLASNIGVMGNQYPLSNPAYCEITLTSVTNNNMGVYDTPVDGGLEFQDYEDVDEKDCELDSKAKVLRLNASAAKPPTDENNYSEAPDLPLPPISQQTYNCPSSATPKQTYYDLIAPHQPYDNITLQQTNEYHLPTPPKVGMKDEPVEDEIYWEPAYDVNELYQQLSTNKYRDIKSSQIKITTVLGSGQFGTVNKGIWQSPAGAMAVAVKQLQSGASEEEKVKFLQEAAINGQFRHPNVVQLMGVVTEQGPTMIVLELLSNGDLLNFLINQRPSPGEVVAPGTEQMLLRFCQHVASGMSYLASKSYLHRDLAARNILVSEDRICKISDFGMSRGVEDENYYVSRGGKIPVKWTAPEALHYKKYSTASDVWSFGCVMYEIWSLGHKPFEMFTNAETLKLVDKGYCLPPPPGLSKELYKVMIQCWKPESAHRPKFSQLVEMLSRANFELFAWEEDDTKTSDPQVKIIGAPLDVARNLYQELQRSYSRQ